MLTHVLEVEIFPDTFIIVLFKLQAATEVLYSFQYPLMPLYPPINVIFSLKYVVLLTAH